MSAAPLLAVRGLRKVYRQGWPSRKETMISTGMVFVMVFLAAIFFFLVDQVLAFAVRMIIGLGG